MSISVQELSHSYGSQQVLRDINFTVAKGSICGLLGPSGSGKTTLLRSMVGLIAQQKGKILLAGEEFSSTLHASKIAYMGQNDALYADLNAEQNLRFFGSLYGLLPKDLKRRIEEVLVLVRLQDSAKKQVKFYSGGMKKRLSLAIALLHGADYLFLDEPTVGIDPVLRAEFWQEFNKLKSSGSTLVISTHVMDEAERCDLLGLIFEGELLHFASPEKIKNHWHASSIENAFLSMRNTVKTGVEK